MAKIWLFHFEGVLKNSTLKRYPKNDKNFGLYSKSGSFTGMIVGDIFMNMHIQLKLNEEEVEILSKYTENLA
jgi:hypothetical protein